MRSTLFVLGSLSVVWLIGCTRNAPPTRAETSTDSPQQAAVRQEFNRLKAAVAALREGKPGAADTVWELLSPESQAAAEKQAAVVKAAFAHRRKTLVNALRDEGYEAPMVTEAVAAMRLVPTARAESLTLEQFIDLAGRVTRS